MSDGKPRCRPPVRLGIAVLISIGFLTHVLILTDPQSILAQKQPQSRPAHVVPGTIGLPLARIQCVAGYTATIFAEGLASPDGLAFGPDDLLYVVEEGAGRVSRIEANGSPTPVIEGLSLPEGITFDNSSNLFVVEDIDGGRVVSRTAAGITGTLATGLEHPEGIVWVDDGSPNGLLYVTESNLQQALAISSTNPADYRTSLAEITFSGQVTRILVKPAEFVPVGGIPPTSVDATFWSYAGLTLGSDGLLYFTNELSGQSTSGTITISPFPPIDYTATSEDSIYTLNPNAVSPTDVSFTAGLTTPEGLNFDTAADFPLYVAEENIDGNGSGRLSQVNADGSHFPFCTGFAMLEDVVQDQNGRIYVSEDSTGLVILIQSILNQAPLAVNDTASTGSDIAITIDVLANDSDPDNDPLSITALGTPTGGVASTDGATVVYTPTAVGTSIPFTETAVFTYQISDGQLNDSALVTVSITHSAQPLIYLPLLLK
jgi:hypothetical protein